MKLLLLALFTTSVFAADLPNPKLTPGVARMVTKDVLCTTSTKLVRNTSYYTKRQVYAEYE